MQSVATTVEEYLEALAPERKETLEAVRKVIRSSLPATVEEGMQYGAIGYYVPHAIYPKGYHCDPKQPLPVVGLAAQKNHFAVYLFCVYADDAVRDEFQAKYLASGKKLDMGKGCVRFKSLDQLPLDVLAETLQAFDLQAFLTRYEATVAELKASRKASKPRA